MKIKGRLTFQYVAVTAVVFVVMMLAVYLYSEHIRSTTFFRDLRKEAVTKAHLFLSGRADAATMQSIYLNNRNFIDEVEVAVYTPSFEMLYHDAIDNDIVKESAEMIGRIVREKETEFYVGRYQCVGLLYEYGGTGYVVTAAAYDGFGYASQRELRDMLAALTVMGLALLLVIGYVLSHLALKPVKSIVAQAERISANDLNRRLPRGRNNDELSELSDTFNSMLDRLDEAFASQKMFVSNVSHELRTPMAALIAELELVLLKPRERKRYESSIRNALDDARRIVKLIDGLLNLAKADYSPEQIGMDNARLDELLLDASGMVMRGNPDYRVELLFDSEAEDDSVLTVRGNAYLLTIAFVNLMENNCKFSPDHTSKVQIGFWEKCAYLRFSDNGIGMSESDCRNAFRPFYRGGNSGSVQGYGIGMALTHRIITLHKGTIEINSHPGDGTTFTVRLEHV